MARVPFRLSPSSGMGLRPCRPIRWLAHPVAGRNSEFLDPPTKQSDPSLNSNASDRARRPTPQTPFFLFIGPDKVGSTWLSASLARHPELHVSGAKDVYYFDRNHERGWGWYERQFNPSPSHRVMCDISHDYLFSSDAPMRIRSDLERVTLLSVVRSPLERSFSQFLYMARSGEVPLSFDEAVRRYPKILDNSRYSRHLPRFVEQFADSELRVTTYDNMRDKPEQFLRDLFAFIGVDPATFPYELSLDRVNEAGSARSRWLAVAAKKGANGVRALGMPKVVGGIKSSRAVQALLYKDFTDKPELTQEHIDRYGSQFTVDVDYLESTFGFDLSRWRRDLGLV